LAASSDRRAPIPSEIQRSRVIAIGRRLAPESIVPAAEALVAGGVLAFEITLDSPDAIHAIRDLSERYSDGPLLVGAGTVLDLVSASAAVRHGARFLVSPHTDVELVHWAADQGIPVFPGAFTPSEILTAWRAGATAVKLFPASAAGPTYLREVRGPLAGVPLIPTGGITAENAAGFIAAGAVALGVGSWLVGDGAPDRIRRRATELINAVGSATP
jgi:2-dehydro-3-deoxyphosphogluconate aldolase/(4S)-4-hydroxy-2-oxoglutarate aldolase